MPIELEPPLPDPPDPTGNNFQAEQIQQYIFPSSSCSSTFVIDDPQADSDHVKPRKRARYSSDCSFLDRTMSGDFSGSIVVGKRKLAERDPQARQAKPKRRVKPKQESPLAAIDRLKAARDNPILRDN